MTQIDRFGSFDGRFPGISLELGQAEEREGLPWLSPAVLDPKDAAPVLSGLNPETALQGLLEASSITHELRHFHDFLLSPLGSYVARARYLATMNTAPLLSWMAAQSEVIPIPLNTWITMPGKRRREFWQRASQLSVATNGRPLAQPLQVPFEPAIDPFGRGGRAEDDADVTFLRRDEEDSLDSLLLLIAGQFSRAELMLRGTAINGESWSPGQIFEVNALITQLQHLRLVTNEEVTAEIGLELERGRTAYSTVLRRVSDMFGTTDARVAYPSVATVATYALLGSCEPHYYHGQVLIRFLTVVKHLHTTGGFGDATTRDLFAEWDDVLRGDGRLTAPTFAGIEESLDMDDEIARLLDRRAEVDDQRELTLAVELTCREFFRNRRALCESFLEDPDSYVRPKAYLQQLARLPRPAVRVRSPSGRGEAVLRALQSAGWTDCRSVSDSDILANAPVDFIPGTGGFRLDASELATDLLMASEMIFVDDPLVTEAGSRFLGNAFGERLQVMRVFALGD